MQDEDSFNDDFLIGQSDLASLTSSSLSDSLLEEMSDGLVSGLESDGEDVSSEFHRNYKFNSGDYESVSSSVSSSDSEDGESENTEQHLSFVPYDEEELTDDNAIPKSFLNINDITEDELLEFDIPPYDEEKEQGATKKRGGKRNKEIDALAGSLASIVKMVKDTLHKSGGGAVSDLQMDKAIEAALDKVEGLRGKEAASANREVKPRNSIIPNANPDEIIYADALVDTMKTQPIVKSPTCVMSTHIGHNVYVCDAIVKSPLYGSTIKEELARIHRQDPTLSSGEKRKKLMSILNNGDSSERNLVRSILDKAASGNQSNLKRLGDEYHNMEEDDGGLKPFGPKKAQANGKYEYLANNHIDSALYAFRSEFPTFRPISFTMADWDSDRIDPYYANPEKFSFMRLIYADRKEDVFETLVDNCLKTKPPRDTIGFIMNTDTWANKGQHWVTVFVDMRNLNKMTVEYYDSIGDPITPRTQSLLDKLAQTAIAYASRQGINGKVQIVRVNETETQQSDSECGVYGLWYIYNRLFGSKYEEFQKMVIADDIVLKLFRSYLFNDE